ncbi:uncharacterized protein AKAME5_001992000 [Lates japonicus]|uniref:Ig-like domain-containing protein n=1 Tax=Lates japonicus TaxID=270547 RepID=A0AAD3N6C1_LATJO|nr:uncharacterized protein AKAME5_001992000 [Lates japonicus]
MIKLDFDDPESYGFQDQTECSVAVPELLLRHNNDVCVLLLLLSNFRWAVGEARGGVLPSSIETPPGEDLLLCLASAMFPPLVQFSWKRQDGSSDKGEQLDLRGQTTSILLVDRDAFTYKYNYATDAGGRHDGAQIQRVVPLDPLQPQCRVKLLCLLYTVLIVKSLVYGCGLSLLTMLRN